MCLYCHYDKKNSYMEFFLSNNAYPSLMAVDTLVYISITWYNIAFPHLPSKSPTWPGPSAILWCTAAALDISWYNHDSQPPDLKSEPSFCQYHTEPYIEHFRLTVSPFNLSHVTRKKCVCVCARIRLCPASTIIIIQIIFIINLSFSQSSSSYVLFYTNEDFKPMRLF